jgi:hypothetical protein
VLVPFNVCYFCSRGLYGNCHNTNPYATAADGGQAEYVRVPFANFGPEKIPEGISDDDALLLTNVVPTGCHAAQMADIHEGETVLIFGAGPIGIVAARDRYLQEKAWSAGAKYGRGEMRPGLLKIAALVEGGGVGSGVVAEGLTRRPQHGNSSCSSAVPTHDDHLC